MDDRERLIFLTKDYNRLKNLRLAPVYVFFIASPWIDFHKVSAGAGVAWVAVCIAWFWLLNRYYKLRYGRIKEDQDWKSRVEERGQSVYLLAFWPFVAIALLAWYFMVRGRHPQNEFYLLFTSAYMLPEGLYYSHLTLRRWYYVVASIITFLVLLPALSQNMPGHGFFYVYDFTFLGILMLMLGIFDHLLLVSSFRQPARESLA